MLATSKTIRCMGRDFSFTAMAVAMKAVLQMTRKKAMEFYPGLTVEYSMVTGRTEYNMVRVHTLMPMVRPSGASGMKVLE